MLIGFTKFAFLANDCGTGKTVTYAGVVDHFVGELEKNAGLDGQPQIYHPVLLLTLSAVTPQTFDRLVEFFEGKLRLFRLYGNPNEERDVGKKSRILGNDDFKRVYDKLNPLDPIVSS